MGWKIALVATVILLLGLSLAFFFYAWRIRQLYSRIGAFPCTVLLASKQVEGICLFGVKTISFYRQLSFSLRPHGEWDRKEITVISTTPLGDANATLAAETNNEALTVEERQDLLEVQVKIADKDYKIYLHASAFAAVISWLDAAGPSEEPIIL